MSEMNPRQNWIDTAAGKLVDEFAQRISRRGVLARAGKIALGLLGVSLAPNLPLDRIFKVEAQSSCTAASLCGIYGWLCNTGSPDCCSGGIAANGCPSCTTRGSFWSKCCPVGCETGEFVEYWDCCGPSPLAGGCRGMRCENNTPQPVWCDGDVYRCTIVLFSGTPCTP